MGNLSLYHLTKQHGELLSQLYDHDTGEINLEIEAQVNELLPSLESKCIAVANWIKKLEAEKREIEFIKNEINKREEAYSKEVNNWQEYLKKNMQYSGLTKVSCPYFTLQLKKNRHSTEILNEFDIPGQFMKTREIVKVETKPDKEAIKDEVLKTGIQVPGAYVSQKLKLEISVNKI